MKHAKRLPPSVCLLEVRMDHRHRRSKNAVLRTAMSGGDESKSVACHSSGAKTRRENENLFSSPPPREEKLDCQRVRPEVAGPMTSSAIRVRGADVSLSREGTPLIIAMLRIAFFS